MVKRLREGAIDLVVATDVAARGLDIKELELVVNYDVPVSPDSYVHRIGRVGRAGREGVAITLADPRESRLLRIFERHTKGKIELAQVPTAADLRARRLELTRASLRDAIAAGELDQYRVVVESLAQEHDVMTVALAAVKLAHQAAGGDKAATTNPKATTATAGTTRRAAGPAVRRRTVAAAAPRARSPGMYMGAGRIGGIRPGDLVGAITHEAGLTGAQIGAIDISDRFSVVEVPEAARRPRRPRHAQAPPERPQGGGAAVRREVIDRDVQRSAFGVASSAIGFKSPNAEHRTSNCRKPKPE